MSSIQMINPKADRLQKSQALTMNINAANGLKEVLNSNIGPKGTYKMLVGGAGQIKITKDGNASDLITDKAVISAYLGG